MIKPCVTPWQSHYKALTLTMWPRNQWVNWKLSRLFSASDETSGARYWLLQTIYPSLAAPLTDVTRKTAMNTVKWSSECNKAFEVLKQCLCSGPVLRNPDFSYTFVLQTDPSDRGVSTVLSQCGKDGEEHQHLIGYYSRALLPREERYSTVEKDCLAIRLEKQITVPLWFECLKERNPRLCR